MRSYVIVTGCVYMTVERHEVLVRLLAFDTEDPLDETLESGQLRLFVDHEVRDWMLDGLRRFRIVRLDAFGLLVRDDGF